MCLAHTLFVCVECLFFSGVGLSCVVRHMACGNLLECAGIPIIPLFPTLVVDLRNSFQFS